MTDNPQNKFEEIVKEVTDGTETFNAEDVRFLISLVAGLDKGARISYEMAEVSLAAAQEAIVKTAMTVMAKCGRQDEKKRREVIKVCEQAFSNLVNVVRAHGLAVKSEGETNDAE